MYLTHEQTSITAYHTQSPRTSPHIHTHTHTHTHTTRKCIITPRSPSPPIPHPRTHTHKHIGAQANAYTHVHTKRAHTHTHTHTCTHKRTHTHAPPLPLLTHSHTPVEAESDFPASPLAPPSTTGFLGGSKARGAGRGDTLLPFPLAFRGGSSAALAVGPVSAGLAGGDLSFLAASSFSLTMLLLLVSSFFASVSSNFLVGVTSEAGLSFSSLLSSCAPWKNERCWENEYV